MAIRIDRGAREEAKASNTFDPIPASTYNATVFKVERTKVGGSGDNADKEIYNVQYRISDGPFENRRLFERVPLFDRWAPTVKYPKGYPANAFFSFFEALGYDLDVEDFTEPSPAEIGGRPLQIRVQIKWSDFRDENVNEVNGHKAAGASGSVADAVTSNRSSAPSQGVSRDPYEGYSEVSDGAPKAKSPWDIES